MPRRLCSAFSTTSRTIVMGVALVVACATFGAGVNAQTVPAQPAEVAASTDAPVPPAKPAAPPVLAASQLPRLKLPKTAPMPPVRPLGDRPVAAAPVAPAAIAPTVAAPAVPAAPGKPPVAGLKPPLVPAPPAATAPVLAPPVVAAVPLPVPRPLRKGEKPRTPPPVVAADVPAEEAEPAPPAAAPPARAPQLPPPGAAPTPALPADASLAASCPALIADGAAVAGAAPDIPSTGFCGVEKPVRLAAVRRKDGGMVALVPPAMIRCDLAVAVSEWIREDVAPAAEALGSKLETIRVADSYDCRPRNRVAGAKMSEHGRGNAVDTGPWLLEDGRKLDMGGATTPVSFQTALKDSACSRFATILGSGSDGYHEDHLHVDLAPRRSKVSICRWNIKGAGG